MCSFHSLACRPVRTSGPRTHVCSSDSFLGQDFISLGMAKREKKRKGREATEKEEPGYTIKKRKQQKEKAKVISSAKRK